MKDNKFTSILILLICIVIGLGINREFSQIGEMSLYVPLSSVSSMEETKENYESEISNLKEIIDERQQEILKWEQTIEIEDKEAVLKEDLLKYKAQAGYETLSGPGIRIRIGDKLLEKAISGNIDNDLIHDMDVLNIINDLKAAGAEAISINGERLIYNTGIQCGGPVVLVNQKSITAPFVISAIGDAEQLYASVNALDTYGYVLKNVWKLDVETIISDNIYIPRAKKIIEFKYLKPIEEGE